MSEQDKELFDALIEFALRVLKGGATSDKEIEILPEVVGLRNGMRHLIKSFSPDQSHQ